MMMMVDTDDDDDNSENENNNNGHEKEEEDKDLAERWIELVNKRKRNVNIDSRDRKKKLRKTRRNSPSDFDDFPIPEPPVFSHHREIPQQQQQQFCPWVQVINDTFTKGPDAIAASIAESADGMYHHRHKDRSSSSNFSGGSDSDPSCVSARRRRRPKRVFNMEKSILGGAKDEPVTLDTLMGDKDALELLILGVCDEKIQTRLGMGGEIMSMDSQCLHGTTERFQDQGSVSSGRSSNSNATAVDSSSVVLIGGAERMTAEIHKKTSAVLASVGNTLLDVLGSKTGASPASEEYEDYDDHICDEFGVAAPANTSNIIGRGNGGGAQKIIEDMMKNLSLHVTEEEVAASGYTASATVTDDTAAAAAVYRSNTNGEGEAASEGKDDRSSSSSIPNTQLMAFLCDPRNHDFVHQENSGFKDGYVGALSVEAFMTWIMAVTQQPIRLLHIFGSPEAFLQYTWKLRKTFCVEFSKLVYATHTQGWSPNMVLTVIESLFIASFTGLSRYMSQSGEEQIIPNSGFVLDTVDIYLSMVEGMGVAVPSPPSLSFTQAAAAAAPPPSTTDHSSGAATVGTNSTLYSSSSSLVFSSIPFLMEEARLRGVRLTSSQRSVESYDMFDIYMNVMLISNSWRSPNLWGFKHKEFREMVCRPDPDMVFGPSSTRSGRGATTAVGPEEERQTTVEIEKEVPMSVRCRINFYRTLSFLQHYICLLHARFVDLMANYDNQVDIRLTKHKEYITYITTQMSWILVQIDIFGGGTELSGNSGGGRGLSSCSSSSFSLPPIEFQPIENILALIYNNDGQAVNLKQLYRRKQQQQHHQRSGGDGTGGGGDEDIVIDDEDGEGEAAAAAAAAAVVPQAIYKRIHTLAPDMIDSLITFCITSAAFGDQSEEVSRIYSFMRDPVDLQSRFCTRASGAMGTSDNIARRETMLHAELGNINDMEKYPDGSLDCVFKLVSPELLWLADSVLALHGIDICFQQMQDEFLWTKEFLVLDKDLPAIVRKNTIPSAPPPLSAATAAAGTSSSSSRGGGGYDGLPITVNFDIMSTNQKRKKNIVVVLCGCFYVVMGFGLVFPTPFLAEAIIVWGALIETYYMWETSFEVTFIAQDKSLQTIEKRCNLQAGAQFVSNVKQTLDQQLRMAKGNERLAKIIQGSKHRINTSRGGTERTLTAADLQTPEERAAAARIDKMSTDGGTEGASGGGFTGRKMPGCRMDGVEITDKL